VVLIFWWGGEGEEKRHKPRKLSKLADCNDQRKESFPLVDGLPFVGIKAAQ